MKSNILITAAFVIAAFIIGYFAGSFKPAPAESGEAISQNATLYVLVLSPDGSPMNELEVDLWHDTALAGPPDAGVSVTNSSGIAVFFMPKGGYLIGFNLLNFPAALEVPREMPVSVSDDINSATVNLHNKTQ